MNVKLQDVVNPVAVAGGRERPKFRSRYIAMKYRDSEHPFVRKINGHFYVLSKKQYMELIDRQIIHK